MSITTGMDNAYDCSSHPTFLPIYLLHFFTAFYSLVHVPVGFVCATLRETEVVV